MTVNTTWPSVLCSATGFPGAPGRGGGGNCYDIMLLETLSETQRTKRECNKHSDLRTSPQCGLLEWNFLRSAITWLVRPGMSRHLPSSSPWSLKAWTPNTSGTNVWSKWCCWIPPLMAASRACITTTHQNNMNNRWRAGRRGQSVRSITS